MMIKTYVDEYGYCHDLCDKHTRVFVKVVEDYVCERKNCSVPAKRALYETYKGSFIKNLCEEHRVGYEFVKFVTGDDLTCKTCKEESRKELSLKELDFLYSD